MTGRDLHARARSIVANEERRIAEERAPGEMYDWAKLVLDQATELESLRDRGDQSDPRVIADADEAGQLPTGSVIVDDEGRGPAWIIEDESITDAFVPGFNGRKVRGVAGFGGVRYSVVYPAVLIHTPTTTTEGTPS